MTARISIALVVAFALSAGCGGDATKPTTTPSQPPPKTAEPKTAEPKTAEPKTAEPKTAEPKTTEPPNVPPPTCKRTGMFGPFKNPDATFANRKGAHAKKYSDVTTTKALPMEACGIRASYEMLEALTCDDGSHVQVRGARIGSVGRGGRCGGIIDKYALKCPERTYIVFMDGYFCGGDKAP